MFSIVARLRLLPFLLLAHVVNAREESLFTSSVTYCEPPESILVQRFDVVYFKSNNSVSFNISAASVVDDLDVTANLAVNVYGMHPINITVDICSLAGGILCPLPKYNFTGGTSIPLPSSIASTVQDHLPSIAYIIPDLEAVVQFTLTEVKTGQVVACVQATLSNGWSMHQTAVEWATGALALFTLIPVLAQSFIPEAPLAFRLLDLIGLFQTIATSALLSLNYPLAFRSFATNFAWAMGLYPSHAIQSSLNSLRKHTGGDMSSNSGDSIGLVNRKLSPYNEDLVLLGKRDVATVTSTSSNVLDAGVPVFVNARRIVTQNAFLSVFITALIVIAIALAILAAVYFIVRTVARGQSRAAESAAEVEDRYPSIAKSWGLRIALISFLPITLFAFYQWTLNDSWASVLFSVLILLPLFTGIVWSAYKTIQLVRRGDCLALYSHTEHLRTYGPLYAHYRAERFAFFFAPLGAALAKAAIVGFGHGHGQTQLILLIVTEFAVFAALVGARPHKTRGADVLATFLATVRFVGAAVMVAFVAHLNVAAIPRVAIGIVLAVAYSVCVLVLFVDIVWIVLAGVFRRRRLAPARQGSDGSLVEKGEMRTRTDTPVASLARLEPGLESLPDTPTDSMYSRRTSDAPQTAEEPWRRSHARSHSGGSSRSRR